MDWQSVTQFIPPEQLVWLSLTLLVYILALWIFKNFSHNPLFHPIVVGAILIAGILAGSGTPLQDYQRFVNPISWMLGPATVALAIPLYRQIRVIYAAGSQGLLVIIIGGCIAPLLAVGWISLFDFSDPVKLSVLTKSITTPLAVDTTAIIGGLPELAAGVVVVTGILGVMFSQIIFKLTGCDDPRAKGLALGTVSHAIGTARAHQIDAKAGAFSTMALCVNGILTAIFLPLFFWLFA
ncbi:LrgB family protein [uncultured Paraglaciecola sp.]|uniref:LrgB family protein n=1 Tax=uncultured Paraglaciecola sp. TaxID=1765024 RepID=UPI0030DD4255|tara:strand:+ start:71203 stop:71916 length:714 start_codon:yes stop_codon:yes gene_type:complete